MKKPSFSKRFWYWFDNRMARGTGSMIFLLLCSTLIVVLVLSLILTVLEQANPLEVFWDNLATTINAWMPETDAGSVAVIIVKSLAAILGLLFTSILIGIFSNAVEEKISDLRKGRSDVLEENHTIILGFIPGEYELLSELVLAKGEEPGCIVVAENMDKEEMESLISENLLIPKSVRIICRTVDICDPSALKCCSFETCRNVVISPMDDKRNVRVLLAAEKVLRSSENPEAFITATVIDNRYAVPAGFGRKKTIQVNTSDFMARIVSRTLVEPGLSWVYDEVFGFNGSEFYIDSIPETVGKSFKKIMACLQGGIPVGIRRNGQIEVCPSPETVIGEEDELVYFSENRHAITVNPAAKMEKAGFAGQKKNEKSTNESDTFAILGYNDVYATIISEIAPYAKRIIVANVDAAEREQVSACIRGITDCPYTIIEKPVDSLENLEELVKEADHIALLSGWKEAPEDEDTDNMIRIIRLSALRKEKGYQFNIAAEMNNERNRSLVLKNNNIDFIVANNMASLFLAQIAETPELYAFFEDLISTGGYELSLKNPAETSAIGEAVTFGELRMMAYENQWILLGYLSDENGISTTYLNPAVDQEILLSEEKKLIVIETV